MKNEPKPFRFRDGESVQHGIRRIARHELARILEGLDEGARDRGGDPRHRDTRRAWKRALDDPCVETLHEWRKRAKNLPYAVELVEPIWPEVMQALAREVERMESDLGEDHDLAMLPAHVSGDSVCPHEHDRELVIALVDVRRRELQARVRKTAARICRERPGAFTARLGRYWKAWRGEAS